MFARIRHLASHTEGHDKGKKSLLVPPVRRVDVFAPYREKSLLFIVRIADGKHCRNIHLSVF